ncbi:MAG: citrate/2-methylcitrate synthase, partial [Gammaproteobacteria bacterium]
PLADTKGKKVFVRGYSLLEPGSGLVYRSYEEALYVLFNKNEPNKAELLAFEQKIKAALSTDLKLEKSLLCIPSLEEKPLILLQMLLLSLSYENDKDHINIVTYAFVVVAHLFNKYMGRKPVSPNPNLNLIENLLYMIGKDYKNPLLLKNFTQMMIAWMDMGLAPSAIATRINTCSRADVISALVAGLANMTGEKHTSARIKSMRLLIDIQNTVQAQKLSIIDDKTKIKNIIQEKLQAILDKDEIVSGFGHYIFKGLDDNGIDPRICLVEQGIQSLYPQDIMLPIINIMREIFSSGLLTYHHKPLILPPNSDIYWSGFLNNFFSDYQAKNIDAMASLFNILTRISGLLAHDEEQRQRKDTVKIWGWITE